MTHFYLKFISIKHSFFYKTQGISSLLITLILQLVAYLIQPVQQVSTRRCLKVTILPTSDRLHQLTLDNSWAQTHLTSYWLEWIWRWTSTSWRYFILYHWKITFIGYNDHNSSFVYRTGNQPWPYFSKGIKHLQFLLNLFYKYLQLWQTLAVLNPLRETDASILQDTDLAGPLAFVLAFGGFLLLVSIYTSLNYIRKNLAL